MKEYKMITVVEGGWGTVLLGASGIPVEKMEAALNKAAQEGWEMKFQIVEDRRHLLFWTREAVHITLERERR